MMVHEDGDGQPWFGVDTTTDATRRAIFEGKCWSYFVRAYRIQSHNSLTLHYHGHHRITIKIFDCSFYHRRFAGWVGGIAAELHAPGTPARV